MLVLVGLAVALGSVAPWWVWPLLVILEGVVFLALGNHWAGKDALARESHE
jgi:predicted DNA repair protein MutK